jgi:hypothetical protein
MKVQLKVTRATYTILFSIYSASCFLMTGSANAQFNEAACCLPNGSCIVTFESTCTGQGGTVVNGRDGCIGIVCSGSGACCMPDGSCSQLSPSSCANALGEYNGNATQCANQVCDGACCLPDKGCIETGSAECAQLEGTFAGRETDCTDDCPTRMPTAFTYQGQLSQGGVPLDGVVDARFSLWLSPDGQEPANQVASVMQIDSIDVVDGLFLADLDFGQNAFNGNARWLQIELRDSGTSDPFTLLLPRVSLNPTPYALQTRGITVLDNGRVGMGTKQPGAGLHVKHEAVPGSGTLVLDGSAQSYLSFFLDTLIPGRKGYVGFASWPNLTIANEQPGGRIVLSTPGSSVFATGGEENLRIIRGRVRADGTIMGGLGFDVERLGLGKFRIQFHSPFASSPAVTATTDSVFNASIDPITLGSGRVDIWLSWIDLDAGGDRLIDRDFHFIAVGPR